MTWSLPNILRRAGRRAFGRHAPRPIRRRSRKLAVEPLEDRITPTVLTWANRGVTEGADDDMFDDAFGAQAELARGVVDAAIAEWNRYVLGFDGQDIDVELTIKMDPDDPAASAFASGNFGGDNIPDSGNVEINMALDDNGVTQWYLDPTPDEHSEFLGTLRNAFARRPTEGGPADGMRDLRSILIHEIGHVMGISSGSPLLYANDDSVTVTDTGVGDDSSGSANDDTFWLFQGPSVNALMTNFDIGGTKAQAGHNARPRAGNFPVVVPGEAVVYGAVDTMIGTGISFDQRVLFTNKLALMLSDLGYDVVMPETAGTFYTVLNQTTGVLDIRGGQDDVVINNVAQGDSDDTITLTRVGSTLVVTIDIGVDHPGTGPGQNATDQQDAFVSSFDLDDITAVTIDGRGGDDTITLADDFDSDVRDDVTVTGGGGTDTLLIDDTADVNGEPGPFPFPVDFYFLTADTFTKPSFNGAVATFGEVEDVRIDANPQNNVIFVTGVASGVNVEFFANGGNDSFVVGGGDYDGNINGDLLVHGGFGTDALVIDDEDDLGGGTHTLDADTYTKSSGAGATLTFQFMQTVQLDASPLGNVVHLTGTSEDVTSLVIDTAGGNDIVDVQAVHAATAVTVETGGGHDTVEVGDGDLDTIDGPVTVHGGAETDALLVRDEADAGDDTYTLTSDSVTKSGFSLTFDGIDVLTLDAGTGNNTIDVEGTAAGTAVTINAGTGGDTVHLAPTPQDVGNLAGAVAVNGQDGVDNVFLHDESLASGAAYSVTGTTVDRGLFGGLTYDAVERLLLLLGSGDDTVDVTGLDPGTLTYLFGHDGNDSFNFYAPLPEAATGGQLVIDGGSPEDVADGDTINVYWQQPKPDIKKKKTVEDKDAGYVDLDYDDGLLYEIDYVDIELVNIEKL